MHANAAEAAVALGDLERAEQIGNFLEQHGERTNHRWSLATGARVTRWPPQSGLSSVMTASRCPSSVHARWS